MVVAGEGQLVSDASHEAAEQDGSVVAFVVLLKSRLNEIQVAFKKRNLHPTSLR